MRGVARHRAGAHGAIFGKHIQTKIKKYLSFVTMEHVIVCMYFMNYVNILPEMSNCFGLFTGKGGRWCDQKVSVITMFCH